MISHINYEKVQEKTCRKSRQVTDFSKVGGLSNHIKILRDIIIVPLLHSNVYSHFNIKTPRGILFYGPPGTGKTLVAGALATEINKEGLGKVSFFQRKGADVLDKWVGESEKKLRSLFEAASKSRPSIIFFDELDGLAPIRSTKNDHIHCSIVTTLLALMDGLDSVPGVIVIGATNRIESVDPALRRPGRFDRELYFPLPSTEARKEILQVHMQSWKHKPSQTFISHLAEITSGFCGSDLQALCAESLLCCMKRQHPDIQSTLGARVKIEADQIKIDECDFINARRNLIPSSQKMGNKMRKLSPIVAPLLERQLRKIITKIRMLWPHFFVQFYKYSIGTERYIGRVVLMGSALQGLNSHLVPAILQNFEHLPSFSYDIAALLNHSNSWKLSQNVPSVLLIPRIDEMWNFLDINERMIVASTLEDIHAGLPILIIATCHGELPLMLQNFFYNNTSLIIGIEHPIEQEIEEFLTPLFFYDRMSLSSVLHGGKKTERNSNENITCCNRKGRLQKHSSSNLFKIKASGKITKIRSNSAMKHNLNVISEKDLVRHSPKNFDVLSEVRTPSGSESLCTLCGSVEKKKQLSLILTDLLQRGIRYLWKRKSSHKLTQRKHSNLVQSFGDSTDVDKQKIYQLWRRTAHKTAKDMPVSHLEVLYDTITACICIHKDNFENLLKNLEETLNDIENTK